jgi:hypothetical protein
LLGFFPLVDVRTDLLLDEASYGAPKLLVFRSEEVRTRQA